MGQPAQPQNGLGTAALILGIVGLAGGWIPIIGWLVGISSILAIIFGALGAKKAKQGLATNRGVALWGMWLGIVALIIGVLFLVLFGILIAASSTTTVH
jgi:uncharacterized membrane protein